MPVPERGISLTTGELACEGVDTVLDAIAEAGATAIGLPTGIIVEATPDNGLREPPLDVDGEDRTLDRPLWGKRTLHVMHLAAHQPDSVLWRDLPWDAPPAAPESTRVDYPRLAIEGARNRNLRVYAHLTPYALPGQPADRDRGRSRSSSHRDAYRPQRLTGGLPPRSITYTGCLNHPDVRALGRARIRELLRHHGDVDGLSIDWCEFPVHFVEDLFTCFCDHCRAAATARGYDWELICHGVRGLWDSLHTLTPEPVREVADTGDWGDLLTDPSAVQAGINAWLQYKAETGTCALQDIRDTMQAEGAGDLLLSTSTFPPPWGGMTGADVSVIGNVVDSVRPKLYSAHWHLMIRWWTETLLVWNKASKITPEEMTSAVLAIFGVTHRDRVSNLAPEMFRMPRPDDHHGFTQDSYTDRLENGLAEREGQTPYIPIIHGYRSVEDFAELLETVRPFADDGLWIQRYGYLRDEKLALLGQEWRSGPNR